MLKDGFIILDGAPPKSSLKIVGGEQFVITRPETITRIMVPEAIALDIVYSDEHIAVINKQRGLVVHPGAGVFSGTLCHALLHHFPELENTGERPGIVHRLDKDTSGLMVIAKNSTAHQILSDDFKHRRVKKIYRAWCHGEIAQTRFELRTGHMRHPYARLRFFTKLPAPSMPNTVVRVAHTNFEVVKRGCGISEVRAYLHTGRTHQIRAHIADFGNPLLGDVLYGASGRALSPHASREMVDACALLSGQALHAETLGFSHPITKEPLEFSCELPEPLSTISRYI